MTRFRDFFRLCLSSDGIKKRAQKAEMQRLMADPDLNELFLQMVNPLKVARRALPARTTNTESKHTNPDNKEEKKLPEPFAHLPEICEPQPLPLYEHTHKMQEQSQAQAQVQAQVQEQVQVHAQVQAPSPKYEPLSLDDGLIHPLYQYWSNSAPAQIRRDPNPSQPIQPQIKSRLWESNEELALQNEYRKMMKKHGELICPEELLTTRNYSQMRMVIKLLEDESNYNKYIEDWQKKLKSIVLVLKIILRSQGVAAGDTIKLTDEVENVLQQEQENLRLDYYNDFAKKTVSLQPRREVWKHIGWALAAATAKIIVDHSQANGTNLLSSLPMFGTIKQILIKILPGGLGNVFKAISETKPRQQNHPNHAYPPWDHHYNAPYPQTHFSQSYPTYQTPFTDRRENQHYVRPVWPLPELPPGLRSKPRSAPAAPSPSGPAAPSANTDPDPMAKLTPPIVDL